jgi:hypothetical protein
MSAALTITPSACRVGQSVVVSGTGFVASHKVQLDIGAPAFGGTEYSSDIDSDTIGSFGSGDIADHAIGTLTSDGTNVTAADTVTIDSHVYTFRASVTTTADEVKIGADAAATLANLKAAINGAAGGGTTYGSATVAHATVTAGDITSTTLKVNAKTGGTAGNSLGTTESSTHLSWGGSVLAGGSAATGESTFRLVPQREGIWTVTANDGTNTVVAHLTVSTGGA